MPFYVGDFMAATSTWTGEERGLYAVCLMMQWASGPLPADASKLCRVLGYDPKLFEQLWPTVSKKFMRTHDGLVNQRGIEVKNKLQDIQARKSNAARTAAQARWSKTDASDASRNATGNADSNASAYASAMHLNLDLNPNLNLEPDISARASLTAEMILEAYPHTVNGSGVNALHAISTLIGEGEATADELLAATQRYAAYIAAGGVSGPQYVKAPERFYARTRRNQPAPWSKPWDIPPSKAQLAQDANIEASRKWLEGSK